MSEKCRAGLEGSPLLHPQKSSVLENPRTECRHIICKALRGRKVTDSCIKSFQKWLAWDFSE